LSGIKLDSE
jgi:hypothetical protein